MNYKQKYKDICKCWNSPPNDLPLFEDWFFFENFCQGTVMDIEEAEACRQQLIAIREGLTE